MPELPEVETTVRSLNRTIKGLRITDVWSSYRSEYHKGKNNIKDKKYSTSFINAVKNQKILGAQRRAKNVLIDLSNGLTILVHMKMTGHFLYGEYAIEEIKTQRSKIKIWKPKDPNGLLNDPMNRFIRLVFTLSDGKQLAFSDLRKFAKICYFPTKEKETTIDLKNIGPEPLTKSFSLKQFEERLASKPKGKIKQVLMDQSVLSGIGNIYSDEILWSAGIHPASIVQKVPKDKIKAAFFAMQKILQKAIATGGDSMSDFRHLDGKKGGYQNFHKAYRKTGQTCSRKGCGGTILRLKVGGRSAHFCSHHQKFYK